MAGLYLHIPFCKQACHYCNFHFSTNHKYKTDFLKALSKELKLRASELSDSTLKSIYFGGGTPSVLTIEELHFIFKTLETHYKVDSDAEITLEANPDDLTLSKIKSLADSRINRLSIGVQSFFDEDLQIMNRAHQSSEAKKCIKNAREYFDNITIDLMYGMPQMTLERWQDNLKIAFSLGIQHLSCYALTVEPKTALEYFVKTKKHPPLDDALSALHFKVLVEHAKTTGFVQYEVCSFAEPGFFSKHNTSYWLGKPYLGVGPSAHSFDGRKRSWNVSNNQLYIKSLQDNKLPQTFEVLTPENCFNEYIMTGLRTMWGVSLQKIRDDYGDSFEVKLLNNAKKHLQSKTLVIQNDILRVAPKGQFLSDGIASDLFIV